MSLRFAASPRRAATLRARNQTWPSPTLGWVVNENLAAQSVGSAIVLDNWFPTETSIRLRGGRQQVATVGSAPITRLFSYSGVSSSDDALFAATATDVFDVSAFNPTTAPAADVSGLNGGAFSAQQITTPGGSFIVCTNGADQDRAYNGSTWSSGNITGVDSSTLRYVWQFKGRLFFVGAGTSAHYLAVDSIGGEIGVTTGTGTLELGSVFRRGGSLMFGASWSQDAGDGVDDLCIFVSDKGEVAVYQGIDPGDAASWALVGVFEINRPLGPNAVLRNGGDLFIGTEAGLVSVRSAFAQDPAALSITAASRPIEPVWRTQAAASAAAQPWEIIKWPAENMAVVSLPHSASNEQYVVNLKTGAWARYTGWDARRVAHFQGQAYFADSAGGVHRMEVSGLDGSALYTSRCCFAWSSLGSAAHHKQAQHARGTFISRAAFLPKISVARNYDEDFPVAPNAVTAAPPAAIWGSGIWGASIWGDGDGPAGDQKSLTTQWEAVAASGYVFAPQVQVTNGNARRPDAELVSFDMTYEVGGIVN